MTPFSTLRAALLGAASLAVFATGAHAQTALPGYHLRVFTAAPAGMSAPDSVVALNHNVWVGFGDGAPPDGSSGTSTVVEFRDDGTQVRTITVSGHNDGLRFDPYLGKLLAIQNEDANPQVVEIDPATGAQSAAKPLHPVNGGGYDDMAFTGGRTYVSASNPALNAAGVNTHPALVSFVKIGSALVPETVVSGDTLAVNAVTREPVKLNLTDPDSLVVTPTGDILMDDQGDAQLIRVTVGSSGAPLVSQIPLIGGVQVDDTVFATARAGTIYISDTAANIVYALTSTRYGIDKPYTASTGVAATPTSPAVPAFVGALYLDSGATVPIVTGLMAPHGMAFEPSAN